MSPPGSLRIGAVGLGVGTIAVYAQPGDSVRFYEINPDVIRFAGRYFSYLSQCKGTVEVVPGDARLSLERELEQGERQRFDVLVVDAFSSDAIPLHLLTSEAFSLYLKHLSPDGGIIAIHVTNRSLDLEPVVARQAEHFGLHSAFIHSEARGTSIMDSDWILLSYSPAILTTREIASAARPLTKPDDFPLWTDQYSNLFSVLH
jgi:spermidine synthase